MVKLKEKLNMNAVVSTLDKDKTRLVVCCPKSYPVRVMDFVHASVKIGDVMIILGQNF